MVNWEAYPKSQRLSCLLGSNPDMHLNIDSESTVVKAIDSHGKFTSTNARYADIKENLGSTIKLGGQTSFFNNQSSSTGIAESTRNDIYIHGININNFQLTTEESITTSVNVDVSSSGLKKTSHVYGIKASNSSLTFNHPLTITASGQTTGTTAAVALDESSHFEAKSSLGIEARNDEGSLATAFELSNGANVAISSENTTNGNASFIIGNIQTNGNLFSINRNDPFIIIGAIDSGESNKNTEITLSNADSRWVVADDSSLDSLTLEKSMLSLDIGKHWKSIDESAFHEVNVNNLTLNQATLQVKVDLSGETSKSDAVKATSVNGNGIVDVRIVGDVTEHKSMSEGVGFLYQDNGELLSNSLTKTVTVNLIK